MNYLVSYDIADNKRRKLICDYLIGMGYSRIQKSVFLGEIKKEQYIKMVENISKIIKENLDSIYFVPLNKEEFNSIIVIGVKFNYKIYENLICFL